MDVKFRKNTAKNQKAEQGDFLPIFVALIALAVTALTLLAKGALTAGAATTAEKVADWALG